MANKQNCIECGVPIGNEEDLPLSPTVCISAPYSADRVVPPYDSSATEVDWREWGIIRPIQDQSSCGSCWSFSTIATAESLYAQKTGILYKFSEQHLVSCDTSNWGCDGGDQGPATDFLIDNGCIKLSDYPYTNSDSSCVASSKTKITGIVTDWHDTTPTYQGFVDTLLDQPLNISFAVADSFYYVSDGIYDPTDCSNVSLNHAMQAVGFGSENGTQYAIIRNQWGTSWAEEGFVKVIIPSTG